MQYVSLAQAQMLISDWLPAAGNVLLRLRQGFKRYWAQDLWGAFFSTLLNHTGSTRPPPAAQLLHQFEMYLERTPAAQRKLQSELRRVVSLQCIGLHGIQVRSY